MECNLSILETREQSPLTSTMFHRWELPDGQLWTEFHRSEHGYLLRFPDIADFQISASGKEIIVWPVAGIPASTTQHIYLNQVYPLALSRQGKLIFHASAIELGLHCIAFIGHSGMGKSTLAASFASNGFRFLTDDGLRLQKETDGYHVMPSHPSIRLWEDSSEALLATECNTAPPLHFTSKSRFMAGEEIPFCDKARLLKRVYFLSNDISSTTRIEPIKASESLIELVRHSFLLDIKEANILADHFQELTFLVDEPLFYRLHHPRSYDQLQEVREMIIEHAST